MTILSLAPIYNILGGFSEIPAVHFWPARHQCEVPSRSLTSLLLSIWYLSDALKSVEQISTEQLNCFWITSKILLRSDMYRQFKKRHWIRWSTQNNQTRFKVCHMILFLLKQSRNIEQMNQMDFEGLYCTSPSPSMYSLKEISFILFIKPLFFSRNWRC